MTDMQELNMAFEEQEKKDITEVIPQKERKNIEESDSSKPEQITG